MSQKPSKTKVGHTPLSARNIMWGEYAAKQRKNPMNTLNLTKTFYGPDLLRNGINRGIKNRQKRLKASASKINATRAHAIGQNYYQKATHTRKHAKTFHKIGLVPTSLSPIANNGSNNESTTPKAAFNAANAVRSKSPAKAVTVVRSKSPAKAAVIVRSKSPAKAAAKPMLPSVNLTKVNMDNGNYVNLSKSAVPSRQYAANHVAKPSLFQSFTRLFKK